MFYTYEDDHITVSSILQLLRGNFAVWGKPFLSPTR